MIRPALAADAAAVARLVNEHAVSLGLPPDATAAQVAAWIAGGNVTALAATRNGEVAGFGDVYPRGDVVRLSATGSENAALLDALEPVANRHGGVARTVVHESDPQRDLLAARGYSHVRDSYDMAIDLDGSFDDVSWPEGIAVRPVRDEDRPIFHRVQDKAFADHWGYEPRSYEEWSHLYGEVRPFDPELWLLAEADGEPAGISICERGNDGDPHTGWIHVVGVLRAWRGRGLGSALLRRSFGALTAVGMRRAALSVDAENTTGAVGLYERAGMHVEARFETWDKRFA